MRRCSVLCLMSLLMLSVCSTWAFAAGGGGGKPGIFGEPSALIDLGIWTLVVFLLLLFVLGKFAWKPMLEGLKSREETIQEARDEAIQASEEAKKLRDELKAELAKANEQAQAIVDEAHADAERTKAQKVSEAEAEIQASRDRAMREIETVKNQALHEITTHAVELATRVSSKTIQRKLSEEDHRQLVDEALAELKDATPA